MMRLGTLFCVAATTAAAQSDTPAIPYTDAMAFLVPVLQAEAEAYAATVGEGSYFTQMLASDDVLVFRQPDGALRLFTPELVGTFDKLTGLCAYGYDAPDYPNLPRTAANTVRTAAAENGWGADTTAPAQIGSSACYVRSALATVTGDLAMVYPLDTGDVVLHLGLTDTGVMR